MRDSYLRGASGYLLVADGTRYATLDTATALQQKAESMAGHVPFLLLLNKADLEAHWQVNEARCGSSPSRAGPCVDDEREDGRGRRGGLREAGREMAASEARRQGPSTSAPG